MIHYVYLGIFLIFLSLLFLIILYVFYTHIYSKFKINTQELTFEELLTTLNIITNTCIKMYENNVFSSKGSITNANYDNFYYDITSMIFDSLSPAFYMHMSAYLTKEAVATIVCRNVKEYLNSKINGVV